MGMDVGKDETLRQDLSALRIERGEPSRARRQSRSRLFRWLFLIALVGGALLAIMARLNGRLPVVRVVAAQATAPQPNLQRPVLSGSGYIVTGDRYISIGVRVPGRIDRYFVEEGQSVRENDPLVQLDDRDYRAALERAEAALAVAQAQAELARLERDRGRELAQNRVIAKQEMDVVETKARVAEATVRQIEAELRQARVNLEYTVLRAPMNGVILAKLKEVGEIAVPGGFSGSGDLIRMANLSDLRAEVDVNEADLARVRLGQATEVTPDAYPDEHERAEVVKLYPQVDRQKGTLKVEARLLNPDGKLLPDMSVRVTFLEPLPPEIASRPNVLLPEAALRRTPDGKTFVWVVDGGRVHRRSVDTVGTADQRLRVVGELSGGESVVVSDEAALNDGAAVQLAP
jgi:RND family efflux transporter MFP subunit